MSVDEIQIRAQRTQRAFFRSSEYAEAQPLVLITASVKIRKGAIHQEFRYRTTQCKHGASIANATRVQPGIETAITELAIYPTAQSAC